MRKLLIILSLSLLLFPASGQRAGIFASSGSGSTSYPLLTGLTNGWNFNNTSGNATDLVGTNTLTASNITYSATGKFGTCFAFNGTSSKLTSTQTFSSASAWSVSIWFKTSSGGPILTNINFDSSRGFYIVTYGGSLEVYVNGNVIDFYLDYTSFNNNAWHNLILTYDGANVRTYRDGIADQYRALTNYVASTGLFIVGWDGVSYFNGALDDILFYNRTLTQADITELQTKTHPF